MDEFKYVGDVELWTAYVVTPGERKLGFRFATTDNVERQLDRARAEIKAELRKAGHI